MRACEGQVDEGGRVSDEAFVVFEQTPATCEPCETVFDDPAAGLDGKTFHGTGALRTMSRWSLPCGRSALTPATNLPA